MSDLGKFLTATEAEVLAMRFAAGDPVTIAVRGIARSRREAVTSLLSAVALGTSTTKDSTVSVLQAIAGAKAVLRKQTPVWTMPGHAAKTGHLTSEFHRIVGAARQSVTAATYNFQDTSQMWGALRQASDRPGVVVTVYVDAGVADGASIQAHLPRATVYRSATLPDGRRVTSHAKFVVVDHELVLISSANFSFQAENRNIEFGLLVHDSALAASVERTMRDQHSMLYELIGGAGKV